MSRATAGHALIMDRIAGALLSGLAILALVSSSALAQDAKATLLERTEKLHVERPGAASLGKGSFKLGEFGGVGGTAGRSVTTTKYLDGAFSQVKQKIRGKFAVLLPGQTEQVTVECAGGEARSNIGWVTFKRSTLAYHCDFVGGGVPAGTRLDLVLSETGGLMKAWEQPQRAGEFIMGDIVLRAETRQVDTKQIASPGVLGYVISKDGVDIAGLSFAGFKKSIYLPKADDPNRTASALLALSLLFFNDPSNG
jgi:hypothetical protein